MSTGLPTFPLDPDYGSGVFRRAVRLTNRAGETYGELEDDMHGMRCTVRHDGTKIVAIECDPARLPMNTCAGAAVPLQELVGQPLHIAADWYYSEGRPRRNCTHLYDLAWWAISHAARGTAGVRHYEAAIPDARSGVAVDIRLFRDGEPLLDWTVLDGVIQSPASLAGRHVLRGFGPFAAAAFDGDALEAALVLHKAYFVAGARPLLHAQMVRPIRGKEEALRGACWTFNSPQFENAVRTNSRRDFTVRPEELLTFR